MTPMSIEFISEYNENTIVAAIEYMEKNMRSFNYIGEYIEDMQQIYSRYPDGEVELMRMVRAAQLITGRKAGDRTENVQAVYHGELFGLELINSLDPHVGKFFKTGYAQSFIQSSLEKDRPTHTEAGGSSPQARLRWLSESLRTDLSFPIYDHDLHPIYEEFGQKATSKLSDETQYKELAMIGFRMIVIQALKPSAKNNTDGLMEGFPAPVKEFKIPLQTIIDLERSFVKSSSANEILVQQEPSNFMNWQDISNVRHALYNKFSEMNSSEGEIEISSESTLEEIDHYIEGNLLKFAEDHDLLGTNDLLSVRGEFYSIASDENDLSLYNHSTEIQGDFDSIRIVDVPSNSQLLKDLDEAIEAAAESLVSALAIRLVNPVFIVETTDGERLIEPAEGETIDIPLNYKNVILKRIKAKELELEA